MKAEITGFLGKLGLILFSVLTLVSQGITADSDRGKSQAIPKDPAALAYWRNEGWVMSGLIWAKDKCTDKCNDEGQGEYAQAYCISTAAVSAKYPRITPICDSPKAQIIRDIARGCGFALRACIKNAYRSQDANALDGCFSTLDSCSRKMDQ